MKIGAIARKIGLSLMCAILAIVPFSVPVAAEYTIDNNNVMAYSFWGTYGYSLISDSIYYDYSGRLQFTITDYEGDTPGYWRPEVYSNAGNFLGYYKSASSNNIYYTTTGGSTGNCTICYIKLVPESYGGQQNNQSWNINTGTIDLIQRGSNYIPFLKFPSGSSFPVITGWNTTQRIRYNPGQQGGNPLHIVFVSNVGLTFGAANSPTVYSQNGYPYEVWRDATWIVGDYRFYDMTITRDNSVVADNISDYISISFPQYESRTDVEILPIFFGGENYMTDDIRAYIGKGSIINTGTSESQNTVVENDQATSDLNNSVSDLVGQEDTFINSMDSDLQNVDFNAGNNILNESSLALSANWVKTQYDRMTSNNVIGDLISYALLFGLGLLIVGKSR